jgi:pimeloyl-ACP methyl ester carboxylesterase
MNPFVEVPGARLHVIGEGRETDPPLVLLHAGIADLRSWDPLARLLRDAEYRVVRFDARGAGETESDPTVAFSRFDDVLGVLDASGIERAVLIGNSLGGQTAFDTAISAPDRIAAVIGVAAGLGGYDGGNTELEMDMFAEMEALENADPLDPAAIADIDVRLWVDGPGQPPDRVPPAIRDQVREMDIGSYAPGRETGDLIRLSPPAVERLGELTCPVLVVAGLLDVSEVVAAARYIEANAPNARAEIWPHVAHMIGMEAPDQLAAEVVEFLAPLPRWS